MRNKGFTLIELLAVIVILVIIALIATPIVLGIINDSRKSAAERSADLIVSNFDLAYNTAYMKNGGRVPTLELIAASFNMDGAKVTANGNSLTIDTEDSVSCTFNPGDSTTGVGYSITCRVDGSDFIATSSQVTIATVSNP